MLFTMTTVNLVYKHCLYAFSLFLLYVCFNGGHRTVKKKKKIAKSFMVKMGLCLSLTKLGIIKCSCTDIGQVDNCFYLLEQQKKYEMLRNQAVLTAR